MAVNPTQERLQELFQYNAETGVVTRRISIGNRKAGTIVGSKNTSHCGYKYLSVKVDHKWLILHRLIWLMETGLLPNCIDHINGDAMDNRWINLRDVNYAINARNRPKQKNNKTGINGVYWYPQLNCWQSYIRVNRKKIHLYAGRDFFEACCRRKSAELKYGFHKNHGQRLQNEVAP